MSIVPIGIDLGTNNSCISFVDGAAIKCVPNPISKQNTHASVVYIPPDGSAITVGQEALNSGQTQPKQVVYCVKRLIGHSVVPETNNFAYQVESDEGHIIIKVPQSSGDELIYTPVDISAYILQYLRRSAEIFFNPPDLDTPMRLYKTAEKAVITVPAAFSSEQRRLTRSAARLAGLDCLRILSEPTAAAMAYIYSHYHDPSFQEQRLDPEKPINLLMFDLGGGTFDVSIVSVAKEGFQVRSTAGNNAFGGEDIDSRIAEDIKRQYVKECTPKGFPGSSFPVTEKSTRKLRKEAQKLKEKLSEQLNYSIEIDKDDWDLKFDFKWEYKRSRLDALLSREFERGCVPVVQDALNKANLANSDIYQCVLVGGSTRIPYFRSSLEKLLNLPISRAINPDEAVSKGAAYLASYLVNKQLRQQQGQNSDPKYGPKSPKDGQNVQNKTNLSTSLLDFTEVSLARGELSAFTYSISCGDDHPSSLIQSGLELPANGEHSFFLRHDNPDDPNFDLAPIYFYIYEGQDKTDGKNHLEPPRRLFEIIVARQRVETQTISIYAKLDSDGVLDLFIVDENEHFQIPNIDLPEIQALLQLQETTSSIPSTPRGISSPTQATSRSPFAFNNHTDSQSPAHAAPQSVLQPRRQSVAFNTSKRLPVKVPANIRQQSTRPTLLPPPAPRAPQFERLPDPPELITLAIPPPPQTQPTVPETLIDKFYAGYANPEFIFMRQYRADQPSLDPTSPISRSNSSIKDSNNSSSGGANSGEQTVSSDNRRDSNPFTLPSFPSQPQRPQPAIRQSVPLPPKLQPPPTTLSLDMNNFLDDSPERPHANTAPEISFISNNPPNAHLRPPPTVPAPIRPPTPAANTSVQALPSPKFVSAAGPLPLPPAPIVPGTANRRDSNPFSLPSRPTMKLPPPPSDPLPQSPPQPLLPPALPPPMKPPGPK
jgi:molecular chaperone DnaK (HSP70)